MAIVAFGGGVSGIRGSIGGNTFSWNKSGPYVRQWERPSTRRHLLQVVSRRVLSVNAQGWQTLDGGDQAAWNAFAAEPAQEETNALGEHYYLSGFLWYVKVNGWLFSVGRVPASTPPVSSAPAAPTIDTLRVSAGAVSSWITWTGAQFPAGFDCVVEMVLGMTLGKFAAPAPWVLLKGAQGAVSSPLVITSEVLARFGGAWVGQRGFARIYRQVADGYRGAPALMIADVVA